MGSKGCRATTPVFVASIGNRSTFRIKTDSINNRIYKSRPTFIWPGAFVKRQRAGELQNGSRDLIRTSKAVCRCERVLDSGRLFTLSGTSPPLVAALGSATTNPFEQ